MLQRLFSKKKAFWAKKLDFDFGPRLDPANLNSKCIFCTLLSSFLKSHLYSIEHHLTPLLETDWGRLSKTISRSLSWISYNVTAVYRRVHRYKIEHYIEYLHCCKWLFKCLLEVHWFIHALPLQKWYKNLFFYKISRYMYKRLWSTMCAVKYWNTATWDVESTQLHWRSH